MARNAFHLAFPSWRAVAGNPPARAPWIDEALACEPDDNCETLAGEVEADICIVGGGFTGLWTAYRLLERDPALSVIIVEADRCGTGASGRNSGAVGNWWARLPTLVRLFGADDGVAVLRASEEAVRDICRFIREKGVSCDLRIGPSVWSANAPSQIGAWEGALRLADKLHIEPPYRRLSSEDLRRYFGEGPYLAGVVDDHATRIQPALLARALRQKVIDLGCRVFEQTPISRIEGHATHVSARAAGGEVRAQQLVLAANAWMAHFDEFRPHIHVTSSDIVITDPIPERLVALGMTSRPGGVNARQMVNYGGLTPDGRVYVGRGGGALAYKGYVTPDFHWSAARGREIEADFRFLYPELKDVPIVRTWGGPIDRSTTGLPRFGRLCADDRISYAIGYTGHGVGASAIGGRILAAQLLGIDDDWRRLGMLMARADNGLFPPEPVRYLVGTLVRNAVARKERMERRGQAPYLIDKKLAILANATVPRLSLR
jgi:glycine/D-amino acid oxidase-like deaminating enzyme